jgi:hypothetical protein
MGLVPRRELPSIVDRGARGPAWQRDFAFEMIRSGRLAAPVAQGNAFLYKGTNSRARDGQ